MADWFEITEDDVKRPHVLYDPTCLLVDAVADAALETITHASFQDSSQTAQAPPFIPIVSKSYRVVISIDVSPSMFYSKPCSQSDSAFSQIDDALASCIRSLVIQRKSSRLDRPERFSDSNFQSHRRSSAVTSTENRRADYSHRNVINEPTDCDDRERDESVDDINLEASLHAAEDTVPNASTSTIWLTVLAHIHLVLQPTQQIKAIAQGIFLTETNVEEAITNVQRRFHNLIVDSSAASIVERHLFFQSTSSSKRFQQKRSDVTFEKTLRHALFALSLMPKMSSPVIVFLTDGVVALPDPHRSIISLQRLASSGAVCHFVYLGDGPVAHTAKPPFRLKENVRRQRNSNRKTLVLEQARHVQGSILTLHNPDLLFFLAEASGGTVLKPNDLKDGKLVKASLLVRWASLRPHSLNPRIRLKGTTFALMPTLALGLVSSFEERTKELPLIRSKWANHVVIGPPIHILRHRLALGFRFCSATSNSDAKSISRSTNSSVQLLFRYSENVSLECQLKLVKLVPDRKSKHLLSSSPPTFSETKLCEIEVSHYLIGPRKYVQHMIMYQHCRTSRKHTMSPLTTAQHNLVWFVSDIRHRDEQLRLLLYFQMKEELLSPDIARTLKTTGNPLFRRHNQHLVAVDESLLPNITLKSMNPKEYQLYWHTVASISPAEARALVHTDHSVLITLHDARPDIFSMQSSVLSLLVVNLSWSIARGLLQRRLFVWASLVLQKNCFVAFYEDLNCSVRTGFVLVHLAFKDAIAQLQMSFFGGDFQTRRKVQSSLHQALFSFETHQGTSRSLSYNQKQKSQKTNLAPHCIQAQRHEHRRHRSVQIVENVAAHEQNYCQSSFEISENASKFKTLIHPKHATLLQNKRAILHGIIRTAPSKLPRVLVRYRSRPQTLLSLGSQSKANRAGSLRLVSYLHKRRVIFRFALCGTSSSEPETACHVLLKQRLKEGFVFTNSRDGVISLAILLDMEAVSLKDRVTLHGKHTLEHSSSCVVQYVLFPPTISQKGLFAFEVWVEAHHGYVKSTKSNPSYLHGADFTGILNRICIRDQTTICALATFDHIKHICNASQHPPANSQGVEENDSRNSVKNSSQDETYSETLLVSDSSNDGKLFLNSPQLKHTEYFIDRRAGGVIQSSHVPFSVMQIIKCSKRRDFTFDSFLPEDWNNADSQQSDFSPKSNTAEENTKSRTCPPLKRNLLNRILSLCVGDQLHGYSSLEIRLREEEQQHLHNLLCTENPQSHPSNLSLNDFVPSSENEHIIKWLHHGTDLPIDILQEHLNKQTAELLTAEMLETSSTIDGVKEPSSSEQPYEEHTDFFPEDGISSCQKESSEDSTDNVVDDFSEEFLHKLFPGQSYKCNEGPQIRQSTTNIKSQKNTNMSHPSYRCFCFLQEEDMVLILFRNYDELEPFQEVDVKSSDFDKFSFYMFSVRRDQLVSGARPRFVSRQSFPRILQLRFVYNGDIPMTSLDSSPHTVFGDIFSRALVQTVFVTFQNGDTISPITFRRILSASESANCRIRIDDVAHAFYSCKSDKIDDEIPTACFPDFMNRRFGRIIRSLLKPTKAFTSFFVTKPSSQNKLVGTAEESVLNSMDPVTNSSFVEIMKSFENKFQPNPISSTVKSFSVDISTDRKRSSNSQFKSKPPYTLQPIMLGFYQQTVNQLINQTDATQTKPNLLEREILFGDHFEPSQEERVLQANFQESANDEKTSASHTLSDCNVTAETYCIRNSPQNQNGPLIGSNFSNLIKNSRNSTDKYKVSACLDRLDCNDSSALQHLPVNSTLISNDFDEPFFFNLQTVVQIGDEELRFPTRSFPGSVESVLKDSDGQLSLEKVLSAISRNSFRVFLDITMFHTQVELRNDDEHTEPQLSPAVETRHFQCTESIQNSDSLVATAHEESDVPSSLKPCSNFTIWKERLLPLYPKDGFHARSTSRCTFYPTLKASPDDVCHMVAHEEVPDAQVYIKLCESIAWQVFDELLALMRCEPSLNLNLLEQIAGHIQQIPVFPDAINFYKTCEMKIPIPPCKTHRSEDIRIDKTVYQQQVAFAFVSLIKHLNLQEYVALPIEGNMFVIVSKSDLVDSRTISDNVCVSSLNETESSQTSSKESDNHADQYYTNATSHGDFNATFSKTANTFFTRPFCESSRYEHPDVKVFGGNENVCHCFLTRMKYHLIITVELGNLNIFFNTRVDALSPEAWKALLVVDQKLLHAWRRANQILIMKLINSKNLELSPLIPKNYEINEMHHSNMRDDDTCSSFTRAMENVRSNAPAFPGQFAIPFLFRVLYPLFPGLPSTKITSLLQSRRFISVTNDWVVVNKTTLIHMHGLTLSQARTYIGNKIYELPLYFRHYVQGDSSSGKHGRNATNIEAFFSFDIYSMQPLTNKFHLAFCRVVEGIICECISDNLMQLHTTNPRNMQKPCYFDFLCGREDDCILAMPLPPTFRDHFRFFTLLRQLLLRFMLPYSGKQLNFKHVPERDAVILKVFDMQFIYVGASLPITKLERDVRLPPKTNLIGSGLAFLTIEFRDTAAINPFQDRGVLEQPWHGCKVRPSCAALIQILPRITLYSRNSRLINSSQHAEVPYANEIRTVMEPSALPSTGSSSTTVSPGRSARSSQSAANLFQYETMKRSLPNFQLEKRLEAQKKIVPSTNSIDPLSYPVFVQTFQSSLYNDYKFSCLHSSPSEYTSGDSVKQHFLVSQNQDSSDDHSSVEGSMDYQSFSDVNYSNSDSQGNVHLPGNCAYYQRNFPIPATTSFIQDLLSATTQIRELYKTDSISGKHVYFRIGFRTLKQRRELISVLKAVLIQAACDYVMEFAAGSQPLVLPMHIPREVFSSRHSAKEHRTCCDDVPDHAVTRKTQIENFVHEAFGSANIFSPSVKGADCYKPNKQSHAMKMQDPHVSDTLPTASASMRKPLTLEVNSSEKKSQIRSRSADVLESQSTAEPRFIESLADGSSSYVISEKNSNKFPMTLSLQPFSGNNRSFRTSRSLAKQISQTIDFVNSEFTSKNCIRGTLGFSALAPSIGVALTAKALAPDCPHFHVGYKELPSFVEVKSLIDAVAQLVPSLEVACFESLPRSQFDKSHSNKWCQNIEERYLNKLPSLLQEHYSEDSPVSCSIKQFPTFLKILKKVGPLIARPMRQKRASEATPLVQTASLQHTPSHSRPPSRTSRSPPSAPHTTVSPHFSHSSGQNNSTSSFRRNNSNERRGISQAELNLAFSLTSSQTSPSASSKSSQIFYQRDPQLRSQRDDTDLAENPDGLHVLIATSKLLSAEPFPLGNDMARIVQSKPQTFPSKLSQAQMYATEGTDLTKLIGARYSSLVVVAGKGVIWWSLYNLRPEKIHTFSKQLLQIIRWQRFRYSILSNAMFSKVGLPHLANLQRKNEDEQDDSWLENVPTVEAIDDAIPFHRMSMQFTADHGTNQSQAIRAASSRDTAVRQYMLHKRGVHSTSNIRQLDRQQQHQQSNTNSDVPEEASKMPNLSDRSVMYIKDKLLTVVREPDLRVQAKVYHSSNWQSNSILLKRRLQNCMTLLTEQERVLQKRSQRLVWYDRWTRKMSASNSLNISSIVKDMLKIMRPLHYCATPILPNVLPSIKAVDTVTSFVSIQKRSEIKKNSDVVDFETTQKQFKVFEVSASQGRQISGQSGSWLLEYLAAFCRRYIEYARSLRFKLLTNDIEWLESIRTLQTSLKREKIITVANVCVPCIYMQQLSSFDQIAGALILEVFARGYLIFVRLYAMHGPGFDTLVLRTQGRQWRAAVLPPAQFSATTSKLCDLIHVNSFAYDFNTGIVKKALRQEVQIIPRIQLTTGLRSLCQFHSPQPTKAKNLLKVKEICFIEVLLHGMNAIPKGSPLGIVCAQHLDILNQMTGSNRHKATVDLANLKAILSKKFQNTFSTIFKRFISASSFFGYTTAYTDGSSKLIYTEFASSSTQRVTGSAYLLFHSNDQPKHNSMKLEYYFLGIASDQFDQQFLRPARRFVWIRAHQSPVATLHDIMGRANSAVGKLFAQVYADIWKHTLWKRLYRRHVMTPIKQVFPPSESDASTIQHFQNVSDPQIKKSKNKKGLGVIFKRLGKSWSLGKSSQQRTVSSPSQPGIQAPSLKNDSLHQPSALSLLHLERQNTEVYPVTSEQYVDATMHETPQVGDVESDNHVNRSAAIGHSNQRRNGIHSASSQDDALPGRLSSTENFPSLPRTETQHISPVARMKQLDAILEDTDCAFDSDSDVEGYQNTALCTATYSRENYASGHGLKTSPVFSAKFSRFQFRTRAYSKCRESISSIDKSSSDSSSDGTSSDLEDSEDDYEDTDTWLLGCKAGPSWEQSTVSSRPNGRYLKEMLRRCKVFAIKKT